MLRGWIRSISPLAAGYLVGAAGTGMLSAYDWCMDHGLDGLPTLGGCHCWVAGAAGLVLGLISAALIPILRRLLEPLIARLCDAIARLAPGNALQPVRIDRSARYTLALNPLARRGATRGPPVLL